MDRPYNIKIAPSARRFILHLSDNDKKKMIKLIEALAVNPRPPGAHKIEGMTGLYGVPAEEILNVRLIYKIDEQEILILLIK